MTISAPVIGSADMTFSLRCTAEQYAPAMAGPTSEQDAPAEPARGRAPYQLSTAGQQELVNKMACSQAKTFRILLNADQVCAELMAKPGRLPLCIAPRRHLT